MLFAAYAWKQFVLNALLSTVVKSNEISKNALHILSSSPILYKDILIGIKKKKSLIAFIYTIFSSHLNINIAEMSSINQRFVWAVYRVFNNRVNINSFI